MADTVTVSVSVATLGLLAERLFDLIVKPRLRTKEEQAAKRGDTSGEKDPAFWKQEFRSAVDEKLDQRVMPILENQTRILESLARTVEGIATQMDVRKRRR